MWLAPLRNLYGKIEFFYYLHFTTTKKELSLVGAIYL